MYMREAAQEEKQGRVDVPPGYGGQLFHSAEEQEPSAPQEQPKEPDAATIHTKKDFSLRDIFTRFWDKNPLKGFLSYDALLSALAVWLLYNDSEEDDSIFLILLFLLFK